MSSLFAMLAMTWNSPVLAHRTADKGWQTYKRHRRKQLWGLLGELPTRSAPSARLISTERRKGYELQRLQLELNGIEPVPALLLIPEHITKPAPAMMYMHWHGGDYHVGKEELLQGNRGLKAYAPVLAKKGIITLAIDSWCFGERMTYPDEKHAGPGKPPPGWYGETDTFKEMLWNGRVLWGMMIFDEWQALNYLCSRPEVDEHRIGSFGMSMGATKSWWLAALDERISCCIDLCCLTDYEALIKDKGLRRHGIYYYVPSLLKHFQSHEINELIVPRSRLSLNGRRDGLTPAEGVERIRDHLIPLYKKYGDEADCHIELFDSGHEELPEMRDKVLEWIDTHLVKTV